MSDDLLGISQPASSQHLRVLRDHGFVRVRADGTRRIYAVAPEALREADAWLARFRGLWEPRLDALGTEIARGRIERRRDRASPTGGDTASRPDDRRTG